MGFLSSKSSSSASNLSSFTNGKESGLPVQTKLSVGSPNDPAEKEADDVARRVVENDAMKDKVQPKSEDKKEDKVAKKEDKKDDIKKKAEDKKEDKIAKKEEKKDDVKKKAEEKKEDKIAKKEEKKDDVKKKPEDKKESGDSRDKIAKKEEKKDDIKKKTDDKKDDKISKKEDKKDNIKKKAEDKEKPALAKFIQAKPNTDKKAGEGTDDMDAIEQRLNATKGKGKAMETGTKDAMESQFEHDFSDVRIHTDNEAIELCQALNAQAFTHGRDIYFNAGKYDPQQTKGKELLAHELTHVVQQQRHIHRMVQRNPSATGGGGAAGNDTGTLDEANQTITFQEIQIPGFKKADHRGPLYDGRTIKQKKAYQRGNPDQRKFWKDNINRDNIKSRLRRAAELGLPGEQPDASKTYVFEARVGSTAANRPMYFGTFEDVSKELTLPVWGGTTAQPLFEQFHVDHIVELQLANWSEDSWGNTLDNMELLDASTNSSSGSTILGKIQNKVRSFNTATNNQHGSTEGEIRNKFYLKFNRAVGEGSGTIERTKYWSKAEIEDAAHMREYNNQVGPIKIGDISRLQGDDGKVRIFSSPAGGQSKRFEPTPQVTSDERNWLRSPFIITSKNFNTQDGSESTAQLGSLTFNINPNDAKWQQFAQDEPIPVTRIAGARFAGFIDKTAVLQKLRNMRHKKLSPIEVEEFDILPDEGIVIGGYIQPSIPFLNSRIDFRLSAGNLVMSKTFSGGELATPPPFQITNSSLTISAGTTSGLSIEGAVGFEIQRLGRGEIRGSLSTSGGFGLEGNFTFDERVFNNANIRIGYQNNEWSIGGTLNIPRGKINGVKNATINVNYTGGNLTATGDAELDVPGVRSAHLEVNFSGEQFRIAGNAELQHRLIESGRLEAEIIKRGAEYTVNMSGTARPRIPGISSQLTISYQNGVINISAQAGYGRGMLSGTLTVGFTNQAVGVDGRPAGGTTETLTFYGSGQLTLQLTPWLQATAGVKFLPNGEIEILGRIALPSSLNVFERKEINKSLFRFPTIEIPIFAIPLGSRSIGLVGTIGGGLEGFAGIGPGQLRDTFLEVRYNPDHEDQTTVTGNARFVVPANAGLRLYARAGIGASVAIARVSGGIELGGSLSIEGEASAAVNVNWTPQTGLQLNAEANITVQPKFKFDVTAYVEASLNLLVTEISEEWRWTLAQFEYGSALAVGLRFPIHYQEGQPFDVSLDDVQFTYPDINLGEFARGIAGQFNI